ncbi:Exocyst complex component Sec6 [Neofusicoccum parvum]|nr:Exocyst complex component Sec6 [Neofusicoccum parvum]
MNSPPPGLTRQLLETPDHFTLLMIVSMPLSTSTCPARALTSLIMLRSASSLARSTASTQPTLTSQYSSLNSSKTLGRACLSTSSSWTNFSTTRHFCRMSPPAGNWPKKSNTASTSSRILSTKGSVRRSLAPLLRTAAR